MVTKKVFEFVLAVAVLAGCTDGATGLSSTSQEIGTDDYGFALVQSAGTSVVSGRSYNSTSGSITSQKVGNFYEVTFEDLGGDGGIALVVAHGTDNVRCKIVALTTMGSDQLVYYLCHEPDGTETSSAAVVQYFKAAGSVSTASAYVYANNESLPFAYCPSSNTYNSTSGDNCITRTATGSYDVKLENLGDTAGSVEITAVGSGDADYCNIVSWGPLMANPTDQEVVVRCYDDTGTLADSEFMLSYHGDEDVSYRGTGGTGAYAWANNPSSSSYTPTAAYSYNSPVAFCFSPPAVAAGRSSQGVYALVFDEKPLEHSAVHVTGFDTTGYCKVEDWTGTPNGSLYDINVDVLCFDSAGDAADASYVGTYSTELTISPCRPE